jgi:hypothetical protein
MKSRISALTRASFNTLKRKWQLLQSAPGELYARLYIAVRLNRIFHLLAFPALVQIRLIPSRLPVSRKLMSQPYWVDCTAIRWGGRPQGGELRKGNGLGHGLVFGGNWDIEDKHDIDAYLSQYIYSKTVFQIFRDGMPCEQSDQYREMCKFVNQGLSSQWQARGCHTETDIKSYFDEMRAIFQSIQEHGYQSQEQLGSSEWYDEVKVFVDRNGEIHKQQAAGHHRLAMAKILNVQKIPVLVIGVHKQWALGVQRQYGMDVVSSIDIALQNMR